MGQNRRERKGREWLSSLSKDQQQSLATALGWSVEGDLFTVDGRPIGESEWAAAWDWAKSHGGEKVAASFLDTSKQFDELTDTVEERDKLFKEYLNKVERELDASPKYKTSEIMQNYIDSVPQLAETIRNEYLNTGQKIQDIIDTKLPDIIDQAISGGKEVVAKAEEGGAKIRQYYSEGADELRKAMGTSLGEILKGTEGYEDIYGERADRTMLPGEDILRGQLGSARESAINRIKEYGDGSPEGLTSLASVYESEQEQLRNLTLERAAYLDQAQKDYAEAQLTAGLTKGSAYADYGKGMASASEMQAAGEMSALDRELAAREYATNLGVETSLTGLSIETDAAKEIGMLRALGYETEADMLANQAGLAETQKEKEYTYNQLNPYQNKLNFYAGMVQQTDPFAAKYDLGETGISYSNAYTQGLLNQQSARRDMWGNLITAGLTTAGAVSGGPAGAAAGAGLGNLFKNTTTPD